jgi:hypothetical protein
MKKTRVRPAEDRPETNTKEYWEQVLREEGLSMNAGLDPGHRKLLRVGNGTDLERIHAAIVTYTGKVKPEGHGPDDAPDAND